MAGEIPLIGTDVLLKLNIASTWTTLFGQRGCTLNLKMTTIAVNWKGSNRWTYRVPGDRDWSIDFTGMHWLQSDGVHAEATIDYIRATFMDDAANQPGRVQVELLFPGGYVAQGFGYMETATLDYQVATEATLKGTFTADGPLTFPTMAS